MPRTLILGNSHSKALKDAAVSPAPGEILWVRSDKTGAPGDISKTEAAFMAAALGPLDRLVLLQLGTQHNIIGLLNADPPFTLLPEDSAQTGAMLIPQAQMADWLQDRAARDPALPPYLEAASCPIFHIMAPPPKEDLSAVAKPLKAYRGQSVAEVGFAPAPRRLALWQLEEEALGAHLRRLNITPLPAPRTAMTPKGYLAPQFWGPDVTHANAAYGALVLDQIGALHQLRGAA